MAGRPCCGSLSELPLLSCCLTVGSPVLQEGAEHSGAPPPVALCREAYSAAVGHSAAPLLFLHASARGGAQDDAFSEVL